jgi:hypothetical protein
VKEGERFKCDVCGVVFESGWSEQEALAEKDELFPETDIKDCGVVCDDCFKKVVNG